MSVTIRNLTGVPLSIQTAETETSLAAGDSLVVVLDDNVLIFPRGDPCGGFSVSSVAISPSPQPYALASGVLGVEQNEPEPGVFVFDIKTGPCPPRLFPNDAFARFVDETGHLREVPTNDIQTIVTTALRRFGLSGITISKSFI